MKEKEENLNIFLKTLKRIFVDNPENNNVIPGLENIVPKTEEDAKLIEELKASQRKIDNSFRAELKVNSLKIKHVKAQEKVDSKNKNVKNEEEIIE